MRILNSVILQTLLLTLGLSQISHATVIFVDYHTLPTQVVTSYDLLGVNVTTAGVGMLQILNTGGIGVVGGTSQYTIDGAESVRFTFDTGSATGISFDDYYVVNQNPGLYLRPVASVTGYAVGGASLGTVSILPFTVYPTTNVSALFGGVALSGFSVSGNQTGMQIYDLTYNGTLPTPEPSTFGPGILALVIGAAARRHAHA